MTSTAWVRLGGGNVALQLALVALSTALSVGMVPAAVAVVAPGAGASSAEDLLEQPVLAVAPPLVLGIGARRLVPGVVARAGPGLGLLGSVSLLAALGTNVSGAAPHLASAGAALWTCGATAIALNVVTFALAVVVARFLSRRRPGLPLADGVSLVIAAGMRSTGTAMVVAAIAFHDQPLVVVPAAIHSISQQVLGAWLATLLRRRGEAVLRPKVAFGRARLQARLGQPAREGHGISLVVFQLAAGSLGEAVAAARRLVRSYDHVAVLGARRFAVVLEDAPAHAGSIVGGRVQTAVAEKARVGFVSVGTPDPAWFPEALEGACEELRRAVRAR